MCEASLSLWIKHWFSVYSLNCVYSLRKAGRSAAWMFVSNPSVPMMLWWAHATHLCYVCVSHRCVCVGQELSVTHDPRFPPLQPFITRNGTVCTNQAFSSYVSIQRFELNLCAKLEYRIKTFANKAPFPSNESKRTKSSLPGKLWL